MVTKSDWKIKPMPEQSASFSFERVFSGEQMDFLKAGHIPESMDDKWFWYFEDDKLYIHRSWGGACLYVIEFDTDTWIHTVTVNTCDFPYSDVDTSNLMLDIWFNYQLGRLKQVEKKIV